MAPSKRTNSAPSTTTRNLVRALKKNKSIVTPTRSSPTKSVYISPTRSSPRFKKAVHPSPQPTKKKAISTNLQSKLPKKRKRVVEEEKPSKQAGLALLKRGAVTMHRIVRRKILGIKRPVLFNSKGEAYGPACWVPRHKTQRNNSI